MMQYIGIPYLNRGRKFSGCDCYGLVMLFYKGELGIDIPDVNADAKSPRRSFAAYLMEISRHWTETDARKYAVVAMCANENHPQMVTHFGVMIDEKRMLHTYDGVDSHVVEISHASVKNQIKGFYRWRT